MGAFWVKRAAQWYYSAANLIRTRSTSDRTVLGSADQGASLSSILSVDAGGETSTAVTVRGVTQLQAHLLLVETTNDLTCAFLTQTSGTLDKAAIYVKNNKLVIGYQCGANGQLRWTSIQLDGFTCTWLATTTAP